jgi:formiminotetrahydrofolate cyclodeaminase
VKDISGLGKKIFDKKVSDEVRKEIQEMIDKSSELYERILLLEDE